MKALVGALIVAAHAAAFVVLAPARIDLVVTLRAPLASEHLALDGVVPDELARRVETSIDGDGPGLDHRRWSVTYRGGYTRSVGATQLVGPFQDPAVKACTGRIVVGQALLDQTAPVIAKQLDAEIAGESIPAIGKYKRATDVTVRWAELTAHANDWLLTGAAPHGYVRVSATLEFERVSFPLVLALVPELGNDGLTFRAAGRAEVKVDNTVLQWLSDKLGADRLATMVARRQIDQVVVQTLAPPPPLDLPGGGRLGFDYCGEVPDMHDGAWAALSFAVRMEAAGGVLPPHVEPGPRPAPVAGVVLALDLDVDALNALLFELWRARFLDRGLAQVGLDRRFNSDPTVQQFLTVRLSPVTLALPPVVRAVPQGLQLTADARVAISDAQISTIGRIWGSLNFTIASPTKAVAVDVSGVELACEASGNALTPCYGDLVDAMRGRAGEFHGALTDAFAAMLTTLFVDRHVGDSSLPAEVVIDRATPTLTPAGLHLDFAARVHSL